MSQEVVFPVLAVDVGLKHTGLAWAAGPQIYQPVKTTTSAKLPVLIDDIKLVIDKLQIKTILIGLPESGPVVAKAKQLAKSLQEQLTDLEVRLVSETLSSQMAWQAMTRTGLSFKQRKKAHDAYAAVEILKLYIKPTGLG